MLWALFTVTVVSAGPIAFPPAEFKLLSADGSVIIGRAHFKVHARTNGRELIQGEYQFTNGEHDLDEDWLELRSDPGLPALISYRHAFFHADGSLERVNKADLKSGQASCTTYLNGRAVTKSAKLAFAADVYAGPAVVLPIRDFIRRRSTESAHFRDFSCAPEPKIFLVAASIERGPHWTFYPGKLVQVDIKPDLGWLDVILGPFLPKIRLWFDPAKSFELVGAESSRHYRGLNFIMVRDLAAR